MFDYSFVTYALDQVTESHTVIGGVAQLFFARFLWAKAGLGIGRLTQDDDFGNRVDQTESSLAVLLGIGAEVVQTTAGFALDLQLRFAGSSYELPVSPPTPRSSSASTSTELSLARPLQRRPGV